VTTRRLLKAAEAIREVVSMAILTELRDPRVQNVTVTGVDVAPDMKEAKVRVSVMGTESQQKLTIRGLENSAGFLQAKIAKKIVTRYTPRLHFELDDGVKKSIALAQLLHQIEEERRAANPESPPSDSDDSDDEDDADDAEVSDEAESDHENNQG
jgi:ribosome-binding factor A